MILLLGATGHLGQAFATELRRRELAFVPLTRRVMDYTRFEVLFQYVRTSKPRLLINAAGCAGAPEPLGCETCRSEAVLANTLLPQTVARVCYLTNTAWGHVSSGDIYSGAKVARNGGVQIERDLGRPELRDLLAARPDCLTGFNETDVPNFSFRSPPCSFYSGTKALAEEALQGYEHVFVWRPGRVFDECDHPRNWLTQLQTAAPAQDGLHSLTHRGEFVRACLELWERGAPFGTYNLTNPGGMTTHQVGALIQQLRSPPRTMAMAEPNGETHGPVKGVGPADCVLDSAKALATGVNLRFARQAVEESLARWHSIAQHQSWIDKVRAF